jgi:hypothetical protein
MRVVSGFVVRKAVGSGAATVNVTTAIAFVQTGWGVVTELLQDENNTAAKNIGIIVLMIVFIFPFRIEIEASHVLSYRVRDGKSDLQFFKKFTY